jgi:molybdopterin molybdotransferase
LPLADKYFFMISVAEAKNIVLAHCKELSFIYLPIEQSVGYVLAENILSEKNIPGFRQSSMDGYAIRLADLKNTLPIQDELPAGTAKQLSLHENACIKVFTGGPVPDGADIVIQKEWVQVESNKIQINPGFVELGANIRMPGSDIKKGALAFKKATAISAMHIGYLASMGIKELPVIRKPIVGIIITGNELVQPGNELSPGQVYESNSYALKACLQKQQINTIHLYYVKDNLEATQQTISKALLENDVLLITGGVSVGEYDFVAGACLQQGVQKLFHGVKQKPGKPLFFGSKADVLVFGLPGNPSSVLNCYQQFVLPALNALTGFPKPEDSFAKLEIPFEKKPPLTLFLKGYYESGSVQILPAQASYQLSAFVTANCWVELDAEENYFAKDQIVKIHLFA